MFAKTRPKSAGAVRSPLATSRPLKTTTTSELSHLTAAHVPERRDSTTFCQHNDPAKHPPIPERKRNALLELKRREEIRATRSRLRAVLIQKLVSKFGEKHKAKVIKHVDNFVDSKLQISAEDLVKLEKAIRDDATTKPPHSEISPDAIPADVSNPTSNLQLPLPLPVRPSTANSNKISPPCNCGGVCGNCSTRCTNRTPIPRGSEWHALELYQSLQDIEQKVKEEEKRKQKQQETYEILTKQMKDIEDRRKKEKDSDRSYIEGVHRDLKRFNEENEETLRKKQEIYERNKQIWTQQLEEKKEHHRRTRDLLQQSEKEEIEEINRSLQEEREKSQQRRERERAYHQERLLEQEAKDRELELNKLKEQEENRRYAQEYNAKIEKDEKDRQDQLKRRMMKLEKNVNWIDNGPVGKMKREEEQREEERAKKYHQIRIENEIKREIKEAEERERRNNEMKRENQAQLERKLQQISAEKLKDNEEAKRNKEIADRNLQDILQRREKELEDQKKYNEILTEQMRQKREEEEAMNNIERSLNKEDLTAIRCNPAFHSKVYQKLRNRIASANGPRKPVQGW